MRLVRSLLCSSAPHLLLLLPSRVSTTPSFLFTHALQSCLPSSALKPFFCIFVFLSPASYPPRPPPPPPVLRVWRPRHPSFWPVLSTFFSDACHSAFRLLWRASSTPPSSKLLISRPPPSFYSAPIHPVYYIPQPRPRCGGLFFFSPELRNETHRCGLFRENVNVNVYILARRKGSH